MGSTVIIHISINGFTTEVQKLVKCECAYGAVYLVLHDELLFIFCMIIFMMLLHDINAFCFINHYYARILQEL